MRVAIACLIVACRSGVAPPEPAAPEAGVQVAVPSDVIPVGPTFAVACVTEMSGAATFVLSSHEQACGAFDDPRGIDGNAAARHDLMLRVPPVFPTTAGRRVWRVSTLLPLGSWPSDPHAQLPALGWSGGTPAKIEGELSYPVGGHGGLTFELRVNDQPTRGQVPIASFLSGD